MASLSHDALKRRLEREKENGKKDGGFFHGLISKVAPGNGRERVAKKEGKTKKEAPAMLPLMLPSRVTSSQSLAATTHVKVFICWVSFPPVCGSNLSFVFTLTARLTYDSQLTCYVPTYLPLSAEDRLSLFLSLSSLGDWRPREYRTPSATLTIAKSFLNLEATSDQRHIFVERFPQLIGRVRERTNIMEGFQFVCLQTPEF
ncbi:hypothetical protein GE21DRAFT_1282927 [Neurospora crassa]|nr:hypothetical protein GE21DRAFT_1282927 [Neurospora crassa]